jgi:hypothetical protein
VGTECLTDEEIAVLRDAIPGAADPGLAEHLAGCERCQSRALFGAVRRTGLRREPPALPSLRQALLLLAVVLVSMAAFFWTLRRLAGPAE